MPMLFMPPDTNNIVKINIIAGSIVDPGCDLYYVWGYVAIDTI